MFCTKCGKQIPDDSKFCTSCGAKLNLAKGQEESVTSELQEVKEQEAKEPQVPITAAPDMTDINPPQDSREVYAPEPNVYITPMQENGVAPSPNKKSKVWLIPVIGVLALLLLGVGGYLVYDIFLAKDKQEETTLAESKQPVSTEITEVPTPEIGEEITVTPTPAEEITEAPKTESDLFADMLKELNSQGAKLESIDVFAANYSPAERNKDYTWDKNLFYTLEDIDSKKDTDGKINSYNIEKKQLINAVNGNKMEYEIYRNPENDIINKIVSIEYAGDILKITDYYYEDDGTINFIFTREDINYIPTYANPDIDGERYYFHKDVMVKWRKVQEKKQTNYFIGKNEKDRGSNKGTNTLYDKLSDKKQEAYDQKEKDMINAAYNTLNIVKAATGIGNIIGYILDENGNPISNAKVKLYSNHYGAWVLDTYTDTEGLYSIIVPMEEAVYSIKAEVEGYVKTELYGINMNNQSIGLYQENVYLVESTGSSYDITLVLSDALNLASDNSGMLRLSNATVSFRIGINNRNGEVYQISEADGEGLVRVNLEEGAYTVEINKSGYATTYSTIIAKRGTENLQVNTSPILGDDEVRIVLTWGSLPYDLDSHLFTPYDSSSGDSTYHIWYGNKTDNNSNNLDVDDRDGYGPETMTINHLGKGLYKYYVADYTNCSAGKPTSTDMSLSGAKVCIYTKDGLVQSFYVPNNRPGVIWELFEIRNKRIIPIQRYYANIEDKTWWNNEK